MTAPDTKTIDQLAELLAREETFVETYETAIAKVGDHYVRQQLEECQWSHQMRVDILREEIEDLGGEVDHARRAADLDMPDTVLGEDAAIAYLEGAEDRALAAYRTVLEGMDFDVRDLVEGDLLPEQERTHAIIASLVQGG